MKLVNVYCYDKEVRYETLYEVLSERTPAQSISHKAMPSFTEHKAFVDSHPYAMWAFICSAKNHNNIVGTIYLTRDGEIGIAVFSAYRGQGIGSKALKALIKNHKGPYLANINPSNRPSMEFFAKHGFTHIQNTLMRK